MDTPRSLVLVTTDCLRADHVGFLGYDHPTTPFLDSIAGESTIFRAAIVAGTPTYYSFPAILASRYPLSLGRDVVGVAPKQPTLATVLKNQGYATAAFIAGNPYLTPHFGYAQRFDFFKDFISGGLGPLSEGATEASNHRLARLNRSLGGISRSLGPVGALYDELYFQYCQRWSGPKPRSLTALRRFPSADVVVREAIDWLAALGNRSFFLWIHLMDPHAPYYPTEEALVLMGNTAVTPFHARYLNSAWNRDDLRPARLRRYRREVVGLYDAGVRWVDTQIGRLADVLRRSGRWDNCIFAATADHGEEFLDHGERYHAPTRLTEELIRVPLLLRVPGTRTGPAESAPFSLLHMAPTLLDALCIPVPECFQGTSLWTQIQRGESWEDPAVVECIQGCTNPFRLQNRVGPRILAIRETRFKLVLRFDPPSEDLYDLEADPGEAMPLPPSAEKEARIRLLERARAHLQNSAASQDTEARLRSRLRDSQSLDYRFISGEPPFCPIDESSRNA
jgi:arylsulfatase A-like enzyme